MSLIDEHLDSYNFKTMGDYYDSVIEFETLREQQPELTEPELPSVLQGQPHETFESIPVTPDVSDMSYALFAKDSYQPIDKRKDINNYDYLQEDSTDKIATYKSDVDNELVFAFKGTNADDPVGDFYRNSRIALGSVGSILGLGLFDTLQEYKDHINKVKVKHTDKKIKLVGHSQGGSYANYIGIDNPDYDTITYNMGTGLPFFSDSIKCKLGNCNNIKNYRVVGDWASSFGGQGNTFMLRPKKVDRELIEQAEKAERFYLPGDVFQAHGINQFIDRDPNDLKSDYGIYGRKIAQRAGKLIGAFAEPVIQKKIAETIIRGSMAGRRGTLFSSPRPEPPAVPPVSPVRTGLVSEIGFVSPEVATAREPPSRLASEIGYVAPAVATAADPQSPLPTRLASEIGFVSPEVATALQPPSLISQITSRVPDVRLSDVMNLGTFTKGLQVKNLAGVLVGFNIGGIAGGSVYDLLLKPSEESLVKF